jgi:hypothetical protein
MVSFIYHIIRTTYVYIIYSIIMYYIYMRYNGATTPYIYSTWDYIFQGCTNFRLLFTPHPSLLKDGNSQFSVGWICELKYCLVASMRPKTMLLIGDQYPKTFITCDWNFRQIEPTSRARTYPPYWQCYPEIVDRHVSSGDCKRHF